MNKNLKLKTDNTILRRKRSLPFPSLGGEYGKAEINMVTKLMKDSINWKKGFYGWEEFSEFEEAFAKYVGVKYAVAVSSCATGLDIAMRILNLKPKDEVVTTPNTFIATSGSIIAADGIPVYADIEPRTFNIDPEDIEHKITPKTKAIVPVHMNGLSADMNAIMGVAKRHGNIPVIVDAAHGIGAEYKGTKVGKLGDMNIFSFQTGKLITTLGEGGMITTDNDEYAKRARRLRTFGWDKFDGKLDLAEIASNYRMTRLQAAVGVIQLKRVDTIVAKRIKLANFITGFLKDVPELVTPCVPDGYVHNFYTYNLLLQEPWKGALRDKLVELLSEEYGVGHAIHYLPCYHWKWLREHGYSGKSTPVADSICYRSFCPSLHSFMTKDDIRYIASAIKATIQRIRKEVKI